MYRKINKATVESMLGGYQSISEIDAQSSCKFIERFIEKKLLKTTYACDCGAGIGRVTKSVLAKYFDHIDLVEQSEKFLWQAKTEFAELGGLHLEYIPKGLQDFYPEVCRKINAAKQV
jgi:protein N-terminal methyltransferase